MAISKASRKKVEEMVYETMKRVEPSGRNADKYRALFRTMNDEAFEKFFRKMGSDFNNNFYMEIDLYDKKAIDLETISSGAKYLGVPMEEIVTIRHIGPDGSPIRTRYPVPVFYVHLKSKQAPLFW